MFRSTGKRLMTLSKIICGLGMACSVLAGIALIAGLVSISAFGLNSSTALKGTGGIVLGVAVIAVGCFLSWVGSLILYGFGELIHKTKENNFLLQRIAEHTKRQPE